MTYLNFQKRFEKCAATLLLLLCAMQMTGCGSYLRASFCTHPLMSFPSEFQGMYDVVIPTQSAAWGNNAVLKSMQVELKNDRLIASNNFPGFSSDGKICQVSGRYFAEQQNADGTFSVTEFTKFSEGMILSALALDLEHARKAKLGLQYLPRDVIYQTDENSNNFSFGFNPSIFVLDNRSMPSESVLEFTTPVSYQIVLRLHKAAATLKAAHTIRLKPSRD